MYMYICTCEDMYVYVHMYIYIYYPPMTPVLSDSCKICRLELLLLTCYKKRKKNVQGILIGTQLQTHS